MNEKYLDCVVIGYNELPFERYENFLRTYGEDSEAYRDLKFSFVNLGGRKLDYAGLLNYARQQALPPDDQPAASAEFKSGDIPNLAAVYLTNFLRRHHDHRLRREPARQRDGRVHQGAQPRGEDYRRRAAYR